VARRGLLTRSVGCARNVQCVVDSSAGQVARAQSIESPVVQLSNVADDNGGGEETDVLEAVLLRTFGADDCCLRGCGIVSKTERAGMSSEKCYPCQRTGRHRFHEYKYAAACCRTCRDWRRRSAAR
jgi:hypothetical protein